MKNTLYLLEMGMDDKEILTDIKNHRIRTIENIDIIYKGEKYNMFFEFCVAPDYETLIVNTEYHKKEISVNGIAWDQTCRLSKLESEINRFYDYTRKNILKIVNKYKTGEKFTDICLVNAEAKKIIKKVGGFREIDILGENKDFQTEGSSYFEIGDTWTKDHKIVRCNKEIWVKTGNGKKLEVVDFCEVDLITGKITG